MTFLMLIVISLQHTANAAGRENLTVRERAWAIIVAWFILGGSLMGWFVITKDWRIGLLWLLVFLVLGTYSLVLRCPVCNWPVFRKILRVGSVVFTPWGGFPPERCRNCSTRL
jgi:hypothetical protein